VAGQKELAVWLVGWLVVWNKD